MLPLGQEGLSLCFEKPISILVTRNTLQMGIFPILQFIPFVPILIPISSHSPISCLLELFSTCCSFIIQEIGCFTGQMIYRKVSVSARLFLRAWKEREKSPVSQSSPAIARTHRRRCRTRKTGTLTQLCFVQTMETGCFILVQSKKHSSNNKCHNLKSCHKTEMSSSSQLLEMFSLEI